MALQDQVERLFIGDALIAPSGHRIDYVDPGDSHEPCYCVVYAGKIHFISHNEHPEDIDAAVEFTETFDWGFFGLPTPAGSWRVDGSGAEDNILWDHPIAELSFPDRSLFFSVSPQTGALKTQARMRVRTNHRPESANGAIHTVYSTRNRGTRVTTEPQFRVGKLYGVRPRPYAPISAYLRLDGIAEQALGDMTTSDLYAEGYADWDSYHASWCKRQPGKLNLKSRVWTFNFTRVFTRPHEFEESILRPKVPLERVNMPLQMSLLEIA